MFFVLGETNNICTWIACEAESWGEVYDALIAFRDRLRQMGVLDRVRAAYYDRCCDRCTEENLQHHIITQIFPGITRAPYADRFHKVQLVMDTMEKAHPNFAEAAVQLGKVLGKYAREDVERATAWMDRKGIPIARRVKTLHKLAQSGRIRKVGRSPRVLLKSFRKWRTAWTRVNR